MTKSRILRKASNPSDELASKYAYETDSCGNKQEDREWAFKAGWNAAIESERKKAQVLVEALQHYQSIEGNPDQSIANIALIKYQKGDE